MSNKANWNRWLLLGCFLMIAGFIFIPALLTKLDWGWNFTDTGEIGDTIGGIMGPIVAGIGGFLTFLAFREQYKANEEQHKIANAQFELLKTQTRAMQISTFEGRLTSMLESMRNNTNEVSIVDGIELPSNSGPTKEKSRKGTFVSSPMKILTGKEAFIGMLEEIRYIYELLINYRNSIEISDFKKESLSDDDVYQVAYLIFYFGVRSESLDYLSTSLDETKHSFLIQAIAQLKKLHSAIVRAGWNATPFTSLISYQENRFKFNFLPGEGRMNFLSHYYRHLYHIVRYVDIQPIDVISKKEKDIYIRQIRAQLSVHEQLLLFYNSLSALGQHWINGGFLKKYSLLRNIPLSLSNFYAKPIEIFGEKDDEGRSIFADSETWKRLNNRFMN